MAKTFEEMGGFLQAREMAEAKLRSLNKDQARAKAEVGRIMSELIADPRWALYAQHLEELKTREQDKVNRLHAVLLNKYEPDLYSERMTTIIGGHRYIEALDTAINLIVNLVKEGESALTTSEKSA